MKALKYLFYVSLTVFAIILGSATLPGAQTNTENTNICYTQADPETIQMQKIAFYTSELNLTPQEAEKFWPLYNEYWEARMNAHKEAGKAMKKLKDVLDSETTVSDSEIKRLSEIYLANYTIEADLLNEYFVKFQKILPIKKAAKIFITEEKFRRLLIKQLKGNKTSQGNSSKEGTSSSKN